jgi:tetratricopeptide (TPR) repeat protein
VTDTVESLQKTIGDKYTIEREIGRGGMAVVFLARDARHDRRVGLKVLRPELAASIGADRFLREIQIEASLQHPHILPLYDSDRTNGTLYYTMPYVEGETLRQRLERESQLPLGDVVRITEQVSDAVSYAHSRGVVHRDLKPENIMLTEGHALVSDFGVARALSEAGGEKLTESGIAVGTPAYMSPEQATGSPVDSRSDVYSLGLMVYEMLAGDPPFTGNTPQMVMAKQASERVPSLEIVRPNVPLELVEVVEKALAKVPADRYQTAHDFGTALSKGATGKTRTVRPRIRGRRRLTAAMSVAVLAVALLVWQVYTRSTIGLNENVIVQYPLLWAGGNNGGDAEHALAGENAAFLITAWLDSWESIRWLNAWDDLEDRYRDSVRLLRDKRKGALARGLGAAYYCDGRIIPEGRDSVRVFLELHNARGLQTVARADTVGSLELAAQAGVGAAGRLLLALLPSGEPFAVADVSGVQPQAIQFAVQAEREFSAGRYRRALELYSSAVNVDSSFALAGVKGAQAASWNHAQDDARALIAVAIANIDALSPRWASFARGFTAYVNNRADSAAYYFGNAIAVDSTWTEGWMGLGEVYQHLVTTAGPQDSLARNAFERVHALSSEYAPVLYHLVEFALRDGDLPGASLMLEEYRAGDPDPDVLANLELAQRCLERTPGAIDWRSHVLRNVNSVYQAAKLLGVAAAQPDCAIAGWQAVLDHDTATAENWRFNALIGLQSLFAALGRNDELRVLLDSAFASGSRSGGTGRMYYLMDAVAGADVGAAAELVADSLRQIRGDLSSMRLWLLGAYDVHSGQLDEAREIVERVRIKRDESTSTSDSLKVRSLTAQLVLAERDTARALEQLRRLVPSAPRRSLHFPWESLAIERLQLARIHLAQKRFDAAYRVASVFDSPGAASQFYATFLRPSLEIRLEAARGMGDEVAVTRMEVRIESLVADRR